MRIAFQSDGFLPDVIGGVEVFADFLTSALRARGHEILVISSCIGDQPAGEYAHNGTKILRFHFGETLLRSRLDEVARLQREVSGVVTGFRPDLLHINDARASSFFLLRRGSLRTLPRLLTLHTPVQQIHKGALLNRLANDADSVVAVSQFVASTVSTGLPAIGRKLRVIANALPMPARPAAPFPVGPPTLLCVARLIEDKGIATAISALGRLRDSGIEARLVVVGDGPHLSALQEQARTLDLGQRVTFRGWLMPEFVEAAINEATIVLMPSLCEESFGLVALQAAQLGRPVIASNVGALPEIVVVGQTGYLVPPGDAAALAESIARLAGNPSLAAQLGTQARDRAMREHDFPRFVTAYEDAYQSVLETGGTPVDGDPKH